MKKLALAALCVSAVASLAAPAVACPGHDDSPKTAEKDQPVRTAENKKATEPAKKTEAPKDQKASDAKAKPAEKTTDAAKKPDKVSSR